MILTYAGRIDPETGIPETLEVHHRSIGDVVEEIAKEVVDAAPIIAVATALIVL